MTKTEELKFIVELFNNNNIKFWIDSGTLLGLYRDGKILDHDEDIDISMWSEDENKLINIVKILKKAGYKLRILNYNDQNFKYKFTPDQNSNLLIIDINLFFKSESFSLCPQPVQKNGFFAKAFLRPYMTIFKSYFKRVKFESFPNNWLFKMYTWSIPNDFFLTFSKIPYTNIPAPETIEKYLEFRYGNWKIPQEEWSFIKDDKGLQDLDIKEMLKKF